MLGVERLARAFRIALRECFVPPDVTTLTHLARHASVAQDDDRVQRFEARDRLVHRRFQRHDRALVPGAISRDQCLGSAEVEVVADGRGREAVEDHVVRGPDARAGEHRDDDLGDHRQVNADDVALADAASLQRVGH